MIFSMSRDTWQLWQLHDSLATRDSGLVSKQRVVPGDPRSHHLLHHDQLRLDALWGDGDDNDDDNNNDAEFDDDQLRLNALWGDDGDDNEFDECFVRSTRNSESSLAVLCKA